MFKNAHNTKAYLQSARLPFKVGWSGPFRVDTKARAASSEQRTESREQRYLHKSCCVNEQRRVYVVVKVVPV